MISKFVQGPRSLAPSLVRYCTSFRPIPGQRYYQRLEDRWGGPRHPVRVLEVLKRIRSLSDDEKKKYGSVFSELLGLPKPPEISTQRGEGEIFTVKLVKFGKKKQANVVDEIASIKLREAPRSLSDLGMGPSMRCLLNLPSVIKQGVTKEEANEIIAKIKAAGGKAVMVMEPVE